jgi:energy-coupling factor transport system substrate-specific component
MEAVMSEVSAEKKKFVWFKFQDLTFPELKPMHLAALIPICVAMNFAGAVIVQNLKLPLFLDFGGTILAGTIAGFWPALVTGFLTMILQGLFINPTSFAFLPLPLLSSWVLWILLKHGWGRTWFGYAITLVLYSISLTIVTAPVVAFAFGGFTGAAWDVGTAILLQSTKNIFSAAFFTQFFESLVDKGILFFVVIAIIRALPPHWRKMTPLAVEEEEEAEDED